MLHSPLQLLYNKHKTTIFIAKAIRFHIIPPVNKKHRSHPRDENGASSRYHPDWPKGPLNKRYAEQLPIRDKQK